MTAVDPNQPAPSPTPTPAQRRRRRKRRQSAVVFLREVPGTSPVHRLWAGTKLLAIGGVSATISCIPTWPSIGMAAALALVAVVVARIPRRAVPRFPRTIWIIAILGALAGTLAGGPPDVQIGGLEVGLGAMDAYARFAAVAIVLIGMSMLIGWTTNVGEIAPALARLGRPLRWIRLPVDEWATVVALCLRALPLLIDELRTLGAARRLRPPPSLGEESSGFRWLDNLVDLMVAGLAVAMRRAGELAEAITARGGTAIVRSREHGPRLADAVTLAITALVCGGAIALDLAG